MYYPESEALPQSKPTASLFSLPPQLPSWESCRAAPSLLPPCPLSLFEIAEAWKKVESSSERLNQTNWQNVSVGKALAKQVWQPIHRKTLFRDYCPLHTRATAHAHTIVIRNKKMMLKDTRIRNLKTAQ